MIKRSSNDVNAHFKINHLTGKGNSANIFENHCHVNYELIIVLQGSILYTSENTQNEITAGNIILIPPHIYHNISINTPQTYERITILFDETVIPKSLLMRFSGYKKNLFIKSDTDIEFVINHTKSKLLLRDDTYEDLVFSLFVQLLFFITDKVKTSPKEAPSLDENIHTIIEFINNNLSENLTLDIIAKETFLSVSTISHLFKSKMQISIKQYLLQKKFSYAVQLLQSGMPACKVSLMLGYSNYSNFYTVFKKIVGISPSAVNHPASSIIYIDKNI